MSKGCFIKFIIILTIVVAAIAYIVQKNVFKWALGSDKSFVKDAFNDSWNEELVFVKPSHEKDSLKHLIENYIDNIQVDDVTEEKIKLIISSVEKAAADSLIDDNDLYKLNKILRVKE